MIQAAAATCNSPAPHCVDESSVDRFSRCDMLWNAIAACELYRYMPTKPSLISFCWANFFIRCSVLERSPASM